MAEKKTVPPFPLIDTTKAEGTLILLTGVRNRV